jgi:hypothetical protein
MTTDLDSMSTEAILDWAFGPPEWCDGVFESRAAVHAGDEFDCEFGTKPFIRHRPSLDADPGPLIAVYSITTSTTPNAGGKTFNIMWRNDLEQRRVTEELGEPLTGAELENFRREFKTMFTRFWEDKVREVSEEVYPVAWIATRSKVDKEAILAHKRWLELETLVERLAGLDDFSQATTARRAARDEAYQAYLHALARAERHERRREEDRQRAVVMRAQKAGLNPKRATIDGVMMEFGQPESAAAPDIEPESLSANPWNRVYAAE